MKVLFLDFDGVLNGDQYLERLIKEEAIGQDMQMQHILGRNLDYARKQIDPTRLDLVNWIVFESQCHVVISSSWRCMFLPDDIKLLLQSRGGTFNDRIVGSTPRKFGNARRGNEIRWWIEYWNENHADDPVTEFVILDDGSDMDSVSDHLVQTDPMTGITSDDARKALRILGLQVGE